MAKYSRQEERDDLVGAAVAYGGYAATSPDPYVMEDSMARQADIVDAALWVSAFVKGKRKGKCPIVWGTTHDWILFIDLLGECVARRHLGHPLPKNTTPSVVETVPANRELVEWCLSQTEEIPS